MTPMTIGLLTPGWPGHNTPNGIATSVWHLAQGLKALGHKPVILATLVDGDAPTDIPVEVLSHRSWSFRQKLAQKTFFPDTTQEIVAESIADLVDTAHRKHNLDLVILEETHGWAKAAIERGTVPVVVFLHGPWLMHQEIQSDGTARMDARRNAREARAMCGASALISPSQNVLDAVEGALDVRSVPRIVIPNAYAAPASDLPETGPILFVGRFDHHKGGDTILKAFAALHAKHPEARLTFVGPDRGLLLPDGTRASLADTLAALPEDTRAAIETPGKQSADQVLALRQTHPIAVIASRYENLNYTMLGAMAAGQAIVSTNVGGPAEVFEDGKTAFLVPKEDPEAMAAALAKFLEDPALTKRFGAAARAKLEADFAPKAVAERVCAFLRESL